MSAFEQLRERLPGRSPSTDAGEPPVDPVHDHASPMAIAVFWLSVIAVPASSVLTIVALSRHLAPGDLAKVSIVFSLSFVAAVLPMAAQSQAAADASAHGAAGRLHWRPIQVTALACAVASPVLAHALGLPTLAVLLPVAQVIPAVGVGAARGQLIAHRSYGAAAANHVIEAAVRAVAGIVLGLAFGATGVAASLLFAAVAAYGFLPRVAWDRERTLVLPTALIASALLTVSIHLDVFLAPRFLGADADAYAVAALPSKGVFLALMAAGWLVIPGAVSYTRSRDAVRPVVLTAAAGVVLTFFAVMATPLMGVLLGRGTPDRWLVAVLGLAMAAGAGNWVCLQIRLARGSTTLWRPAALAIAITVIGSAFTDNAAGLATFLLLGQFVALLGGIRALQFSLDELDTDATADAATSRHTFDRGIAPATRRVTTTTKLHPAAIAAAGAAPERIASRTLAWLSGAVAAFVFLQHPGQTVAETKLDVAVDPLLFLGRTLHLWEPVADLGHVQNQAVGYLFPMGPFFVAGHALHIPTWIVQRSWVALVLVAALWGAARLGDALEIGTSRTRVIGAVAYALSPFFMARVGMTSAMVLGGAMLPWILLPLVRASRVGSVRRGACLSALGVFAIGGVNGAVTLAVLVMPAMWLATRTRGRRRSALATWWLIAVGLACAWWFIPLVFQLRFGFNFLPYTERAMTTAGYTPTVEVLRGTADWLSYLHLREAWVPAGWALVSDPAVIVATAAIAGAGLFGLSRRDLRHRTFLLLTFIAGVAIMGAGYGGLLGDPVAIQVRALLDGPAAMFRNVYKFQPIIGLPLAFGLTHTLTIAEQWAKGGARRQRSLRRRVHTTALCLAGLAIIVAALPLFAGNLLSDKGFDEIPSWWQDAEAVTAGLTSPGRTLIVPGTPAGDYTWGRTADEPMQALSDAPWASRSLIPLGGPGSTRVLDAVEQAIERGGDPALPAYLERAGIDYVIARNDVNWQEWNAPRPAQVQRALLVSGLAPAQSFGPTLPLEHDAADPGFGIAEAEHQLHALELYRVADVTNTRIASYAVADAAVVSGGPEAGLALARAGLGDRATILAGDLSPDQPTPTNWIVTDTLRRRNVEFGLMRDNSSYTLTANETAPGGQKVDQLLPSDGIQHQTVAELRGVAGITASSYGSWLYQIPEVAPTNALDDDPSTVWVAGPTHTSAGEWLQTDFSTPLSTRSVDVTLLEDGTWRPQVHAMRVTTETGSIVTAVRPDESRQHLDVPAGPTHWMRVGFESVSGETEHSAGAGLRELAIPGVEVHRFLVAPSELRTTWSDPSKPAPTFVFDRATTDPRSMLRTDEESQLLRQFTLPHSASLAVEAAAAPVAGPALTDLVYPEAKVHITASSTLMNLPEYQPQQLLDDRGDSVWVAQPPDPSHLPAPAVPGRDALSDAPTPTTSDTAGPIVQRVDPNPTLHLSWAEPRALDTIALAPVAGFSAPKSVHIESPDGTRDAAVAADGAVHFASLTTDKIDLSFPDLTVRTSTNPLTGAPSPMPLALSGVRVPALADLAAPRFDPGRVIHIGCDAGPQVSIDGSVRHFALDASAGDLVALRPLALQPCDDRPLALAAGPHDLVAAPASSPFAVTSAVLHDPKTMPLDGAATGAPGHTARPADTTRWDPENRQVRVGAGDATYLAVNENFSTGWTATLDGRPLDAVRLDGWRQGFIVPAGGPGVVELRFAPALPYRVGLAIGALLVVALIALALIPDRRTDRPARLRDATLPWWLLAAVAGVAAVVTGGIALLLALPLWLLARSRPRLLPPIAAGAMLLAGVAVAMAPGQAPGDHAGAFGIAAAALATIAFVALLVSAVDLPVRTPPPDPDDGTAIDLRDTADFGFGPAPRAMAPPHAARDGMWRDRVWERQGTGPARVVEHRSPSRTGYIAPPSRPWQPRGTLPPPPLPPPPHGGTNSPLFADPSEE